MNSESHTHTRGEKEKNHREKTERDQEVDRRVRACSTILEEKGSRVETWNMMEKSRCCVKYECVPLSSPDVSSPPA
jgi:hypothetical protein